MKDTFGVPFFWSGVSKISEISLISTYQRYRCMERGMAVYWKIIAPKAHRKVLIELIKLTLLIQLFYAIFLL